MINLRNLFKPKEKQKILIFAGAGLSQESGLDTFRDEGGLWSKYNIEELCDMRTFHKNREAVFEFYNERKKEILTKSPNSAHYHIANIQKKYGANRVLIFTSNIDNLLEKAGSKDVYHIHEDLFGMKCLECEHVWHIGDNLYNSKDKCPKCQSTNTKPSIIFFNEASYKYKKLRSDFESCGTVINRQIIPNIKIIIGTSFQVIRTEIIKPERGYSLLVDKKELNISGFDKTIVKPATESLEDIDNFINQWIQ